MTRRHTCIWVGIDAGKGHHRAVAVSAEGERLFSTKVINDEAQILTLIHSTRAWGRSSAAEYGTNAAPAPAG